MKLSLTSLLFMLCNSDNNTPGISLFKSFDAQFINLKKSGLYDLPPRKKFFEYLL